MLSRGKYGVEWTESPADKESSSLAGVVVVVVLVAILSLVWTLISHYRDKTAEDAATAVEESVAQEIKLPSQSPAKEQPVIVETPPKPVVRHNVVNRPKQVKNLLMRLEEAQARHDIEMEVSTIEQLRTLPGSPAADLDDALARRLGRLNFRRLFEKRSGLWVKQITVRSGHSASRIASENGSTFASFAKLNGGKVDTIFAGKKMFVMDHPRFILVIHRKLDTADLQLNGKFFKRYDCKSRVELAEGSYEWGAVSAKLDIKDKSELELMMPKASSVVVSEM